MRIEGYCSATVIDRIAERVAWDGRCLLWLGSNCRGYGQIWIGSRVDGTRRLARINRIVLEHQLGRTLEADEWALHACDNPPCVNPDHLYAGSQFKNVRDMVERGRQRTTPMPGEANSQARLTWAQVAQIRATYPAMSQRALARQHGVTKSTIARIVHKECWR